MPSLGDIRSGNCPLCDHHEIVEAIPAEFTDGSGEVSAAVAYEPRWVFSGRDPTAAYGHLRLYVCRSCGFTQWFTDEPDRVPIGERYHTRVIAGTKRNTYR